MTIEQLIGPKGKVPILIRDDDINYFTKPEMLESIYSNAWDEGFKVSLSTIPLQKGLNDLGVPPPYRQSGLLYSILDNPLLLKYLKSKIKERSVEILQHGLSHTYDSSNRGEFSGNSSLKENVLKGRRILLSAFETEPNFFVPPAEDISKTNLDLIHELGMKPIYRNSLFDKLLRFRYIPSFMKNFGLTLITTGNSIFFNQSQFPLMKPVNIQINGNSITWSLPSTKFLNLASSTSVSELTRFLVESCSVIRNPICILNHYHSYYHDWNSTITKTDLFRTWSSVLKSFGKLGFEWKVDFATLFERYSQVQRVKLIKTGSKITIRSEEEIQEYSFRTSHPLEYSTSGTLDSNSNIFTIERILPESTVVLYEKN